MRKTRVYENVVIGNFLYGLGYAIRSQQQSGCIASCVNLLQQTPADHLLGDLLLAFPGVCRLIEFKAKDARPGKEVQRHRRLSKALEGNDEMTRISRRVHWFVEVVEASDLDFDVRSVPYLNAFSIDENRQPLTTLIDETAAEVVQADPTRATVGDREYLDFVRIFAGGGKVGTGGLLMVADASGTLHYAHLLDLSELRLPHVEWVKLHEARLERDLAPTLAQQRSLPREQEHELTKERTIDRDRGMSR